MSTALEAPASDELDMVPLVVEVAIALFPPPLELLLLQAQLAATAPSNELRAQSPALTSRNVCGASKCRFVSQAWEMAMESLWWDSGTMTVRR